MIDRDDLRNILSERYGHEYEITESALDDILALDDPGETAQTFYRALLPNGRLWVESRSQDETLTQAALANDPVTYETLRVYQCESAWQPWIPDPAAIADAERDAADIRSDMDDEQEAGQ